MFVPYIFSVIVLWGLLFHPEVIQLMPVHDQAVKQLLFGALVIFGWCAITVGSLQRDDH